MRLFALNLTQEGPSAAMNRFFQALLEQGVVHALLLPQEVDAGTSVVHTLAGSPSGVRAAAPAAPVSPVNAARLVSALTLGETGKRVGAVLRACEWRALVELVKLKQARLDSLLVIGIDCLGTFEPRHYRRLVDDGRLTPDSWIQASGGGTETAAEGISLRQACRICSGPVVPFAPMHLGWAGVDGKPVLYCEDSLAEILKELPGLSPCGEPSGRASFLENLEEGRAAAREEAVSGLAAKLKGMDALAGLLASCLNCHNCRQACPVCFCRQCVFEGEAFDHDSQHYLKGAARKGLIKMPVDNLLFHLTRINHMGLSCVGCGFCESACPSGLPLSLLFQTFGRRLQSIFDYLPGRDPEEKLPLSTYREVELDPR